MYVDDAEEPRQSAIKQISVQPYIVSGECAKLSHARLQQKLKGNRQKTTDTRTTGKQKSTRSKQTEKRAQ